MKRSDTVAEAASPTLPVEDAKLRAKLALSRRIESLPLVVALILVIIVFQAVSGLFLHPRNLVNLLTELTPLGFIAIASTVMIIMGEIDLSVGSIAGFTGAVLAVVLLNDGIPWPIAVAICFIFGIGVSGLQGLIVVVGGVRSFAVTLAGYLVWYGVQLAVLGASGYIPLRRAPLNELSLVRIPEFLSLSVVAVVGIGLVSLRFFGDRQGRRRQSSWTHVLQAAFGLVVTAALLGLVIYLERGGGLPLVFVLLLAVTTAMWILLTRTALGRHMYAVGGDLHAARESGINVLKVKWLGFVLAGALATCAGIAILSYTGGADTSAGTGALLLAGIGATVVGGVSLTGGRGSLWGAFGGAILLASVANGLNLMSLSFYAVYIVEGLVVLAALLTDAGLRRRLASR